MFGIWRETAYETLQQAQKGTNGMSGETRRRRRLTCRFVGMGGFAVALLVAGLTIGCAGTSPTAATVGRGSEEWGAAPPGTRSYPRSGPERRDRADLPSLTHTSTLADYLRYAALNNPGLEAAFERWQAELEKVPQVRALPDPILTYAHFIEEVETRVGPQESKLSLLQKFPWFGKRRLRGEAACEFAPVPSAHSHAETLEM